MCVPPFCRPARRCLGCIPLRYGATAVLVVDAAYGLAMVVVHALLLGEMGEQVNSGQGLVHAPNADNWFLQILDLDIAWAHRLLGFEDYGCLLCGLIYGILIICLCVFTLNAVIGGANTSRMASRWFVAFMHIELILYGGLTLAKFPKICDLRRDYLPLLEAGCEVLRYTYFERALIRICIGSVCLWVFGSYAYLAGKGEEFVDNHRIKVDDESDDEHMGPYAYQRPRGIQYSHGSAHGRHVAPSAQSYAPHTGSHAWQDSSFVGQPVRAMNASHHAFSHVPRAHSSVLVVPRAHSSAVTTTSNGSAYETTSLIRPPIAIH